MLNRFSDDAPRESAAQLELTWQRHTCCKQGRGVGGEGPGDGRGCRWPAKKLGSQATRGIAGFLSAVVFANTDVFSHLDL